MRCTFEYDRRHLFRDSTSGDLNRHWKFNAGCHHNGPATSQQAAWDSRNSPGCRNGALRRYPICHASLVGCQAALPGNMDSGADGADAVDLRLFRRRIWIKCIGWNTDRIVYGDHHRLKWHNCPHLYRKRCRSIIILISSVTSRIRTAREVLQLTQYPSPNRTTR